MWHKTASNNAHVVDVLWAHHAVGKRSAWQAQKTFEGRRLSLSGRGGQVPLFSMHLWKEYARSATADTENARNTHEEAPNVSASIIACAKRCLVKYTVLQRIVVFAWSVDKSPWIKISKITIYFCIRVSSESLRSVKTSTFVSKNSDWTLWKWSTVFWFFCK